MDQINQQPQVTQEQPAQDPKELSAFAKLASQERFQTDARKKLDEERRAFDADRQELEEYKKVKALRDSDPLKIIEHFGFDLETLNRKAQERNSPIDPVAAKALAAVEQIKADLEAEKASVVKEKLTQQQQWIASEISKTVKEGGYDVIENLGLENSVMEYMEEIYNATGKAPTFQEACESVTEYVAERAQKIMGSKWLKPKEPEALKSNLKPASLTNRMAQGSERSGAPMNEDERMREALKVLRSSNS